MAWLLDGSLFFLPCENRKSKDGSQVVTANEYILGRNLEWINVTPKADISTCEQRWTLLYCTFSTLTPLWQTRFSKDSSTLGLYIRYMSGCVYVCVCVRGGVCVCIPAQHPCVYNFFFFFFSGYSKGKGAVSVTTLTQNIFLMVTNLIKQNIFLS